MAAPSAVNQQPWEFYVVTKEKPSLLGQIGREGRTVSSNLPYREN